VLALLQEVIVGEFAIRVEIYKSNLCLFDPATEAEGTYDIEASVRE
jgi:hypothetical protein